MAVDLKGSFMPKSQKEDFNMIKGLLIHSIREVFSNPDTNFLALYGLPELYVLRGNNNLDTCFQYAVKD